MTKRDRRVAALVKILTRTEALIEADMVSIYRKAGRLIASHWLKTRDHEWGLEAVRILIEAALRKRLLTIALVYGEENLANARRHKAALQLMTKDAENSFAGFIAQWVRDHALRASTLIVGTIRATVVKVITSSIHEGLGERETAKKIQDIVGNDRASAARIARTEGHSAAGYGAQGAAEASGLDMDKEWAAVEDARTRESHKAADGQTVPMGERFRVGSTTMDFPGDPGAPANEIVNCRCVALYHPRIGGEILL